MSTSAPPSCLLLLHIYLGRCVEIIGFSLSVGAMSQCISVPPQALKCSTNLCPFCNASFMLLHQSLRRYGRPNRSIPDTLTTYCILVPPNAPTNPCNEGAAYETEEVEDVELRG